MKKELFKKIIENLSTEEIKEFVMIFAQGDLLTVYRDMEKNPQDYGLLIRNLVAIRIKELEELYS